MKKLVKHHFLWILFATFCVLAILFRNEPLLISETPYGIGKFIAWIVFLTFLIYTINISRQELFFKSLKRMSPILWTHQVGVDLYIGISIFLIVIYLNEPSFLVFLLWVIPCIIFANLTTLLYVALHFDSLVGLFMS